MGVSSRQSRRAWSGRAACIAGAFAILGATSANGQSSGLAPTLSGFPSNPLAERAVRISSAGLDIRFRPPATTTLLVAHTFWRRAGVGCVLALHADDAGAPGARLATAAVSPARGWTATPLAASLVAGALHHLVVTCTPGTGRLGYVVDAERAAVTAGAWELHDLGRGVIRRHGRPVSPLFALALADGTWWGHPYRGTPRGAGVRVCGPSEVRQLLVSSRNLSIGGVELSLNGVGGRGDLAFTLSAMDGREVMAGQLVRHYPDANRFRALVVAGGGVPLAAGTPYVLRLRAPDAERCSSERALRTDLAVGTHAGGLHASDLRQSRDGGRTWSDARGFLSVALLPPPPPPPPPPVPRCGDGRVEGEEACDGSADAACPGRCDSSCRCLPEPPPAPRCGDGEVQSPEECDGAADATCPGRCTAECACPVAPAYRSIYASGYFGVYDPATIPVWPQRMGVVLGGVDGQSALVAEAKRVAAAAGNPDARFVFYFSLTSLDAKCGCFDAHFYQSFLTTHPEWFLRDAAGNRLSTFVYEIGEQRQFAVDIGNPAYLDAWADWALAAMERWGWDGVWADNVLRGLFYGWSGHPINPRTRQRYTTAEYRQDTLTALRHLRRRFDARGKLLIGNHGAAYEPDTFADPVIQDTIRAMHGVEIEDCVYTFSGTPHSEANWIGQLRYLAFANQHGVLTQCRGGNGTITDPAKRDYILASYLLSKEGFSNVAQFNGLRAWWPGLEVDLGRPLGGYGCLDPAAGLRPTASCPSPGKLYVREWERGRVLVNPTAATTATVPLGAEFLRGTTRVTAVTLGPRSGVVLTRP